VVTVTRLLHVVGRILLGTVVALVVLWVIGLIVHALVDLPESGSRVIGW
jgi:hypothetical protein